MSPLPAEIRLGVGNPDVKVTFGSIQMNALPVDRNGGAWAGGTLHIDNIQIEVPASQPAGGR